MSSVRVSAVKVYLQHTLSSALLIVARLQQGWEKADPRTMKAAELWVETIRNAHNVCGVYGLVAIDRAEEYLLHRIKLEVYQGKVTVNISEHHVELCQGAAKFYSRALSQQKTGVGELVELWEYAGYCADRVWMMRHVSTERNLYCIDHAEASDALTPAEVCCKEAKIAAKNGHLECARLWALMSKHYQSAAAFTCIGSLHGIFSKLLGGYCTDGGGGGFGGGIGLGGGFNGGFGGGFGGSGGESGSGTKFKRDLQRRASAALVAVRHLTKAVDCATKATEAELKGSTPLQALWQRAASQLEHAAAIAVANALERVDSRDPIAFRVSRLIGLADSLTPLVYQYEEHRAVPRSSAGTAWLQETGKQLAEVFKQISESYFYNLPGAVVEQMSVPMLEEERLDALIKKIEDCLKHGQLALSREQRAIEHYSAQARAVDPKRSPAHAHIEECWLQAAVQMRSAEEELIAASTSSAFDGVATAFNGDLLALSKHRKLEECAKELARLAVGIFADAAAYYAKAECATSAQAQQLWTEAADLWLKVGVSEKKAVMYSSLSGQTTSSEPIFVFGRCAQRCAEAAACCEKLGDEATSIIAAIINNSTDATATFHSRELQLRLAAVEFEREVTHLQHGAVTTIISHIRLMFSSAIALVLEQTATLRAFPPGHILHQEPQEQRIDQLVWMCDTVLDIASLTRRIYFLSENWNGEAIVCLEKALTCGDRVRSLVFGFQEERFNGFGGEFGGSNDDNETYEVSTPGTGCAPFQLACRRHLEAVRTRLDGEPVQSLLWSKAAEYTTRKPLNYYAYSVYGPMNNFREAVCDGLVRAAWKLRKLPGPPPDGVLVDLSNAVTSEAAMVNLVVKAEVEAKKHFIAEQGIPAGKKFAPILALHKSAVLHYTAASRYAFVEVEGGAGTEQLKGMAKRALTAAGRFAIAAKTLEKGQTDVSCWYKLAGECSSVSPPSQSTNSNSKPPDKVEQKVADIAGDRYEATAWALAAGNNASFERWRKAAEATGELVDVTVAKVTMRVGITRSVLYSSRKVEESDRLAKLAQDADDAEQDKRYAEWKAATGREVKVERVTETMAEADFDSKQNAVQQDCEAEDEAERDDNAEKEKDTSPAVTLTGKRKFAS